MEVIQIYPADIIMTPLFLTFLTFRDHPHFFVGQSLPSSSSSYCLFSVMSSVSSYIFISSRVLSIRLRLGCSPSYDRRLFHRCGASVDLELSCLKTLLSLEVKGSSEGILYDEIYIFCMCI